MPVHDSHSVFSPRYLSVLVLIGAISHPGLAYSDSTADAAAQTAATEARSSEEDLDHAWMGEFAGPVALGPNRYQATALQIRPVGEGSFEAIQYVGGLPGERTFRDQPVTLIGKRAGDFLVLSGAPWAIFVGKEVCVVIDRAGKEIGRLQRVQRQSPTLGAAPPKDAMVLFDGSGTEQFTVAEMTEEGLLTEGADIHQLFQDFNLHLEFLLPYMPAMRGQARGNSGIYVQSRYEVQILDSFATEPVFDGCGALYRFRKPDLNMCFPPGEWQTYDLVFTSPRWASDGTKLRNARVTVWLNGVKVQDDVELADKTGHGEPEEPVLLPIRLQNHKCPVRYRNIWIVDRGLVNTGQFPVHARPETTVEKRSAKEDNGEKKPIAAKEEKMASGGKDQDKAKRGEEKRSPPVEEPRPEPKAKPAAEAPAAAPKEESAGKSEKKEQPQKPAAADAKPASASPEKASDGNSTAKASKPDPSEPESDSPKEEEPREQKRP